MDLLGAQAVWDKLGSLTDTCVLVDAKGLRSVEYVYSGNW